MASHNHDFYIRGQCNQANCWKGKTPYFCMWNTSRANSDSWVVSYCIPPLQATSVLSNISNLKNPGHYAQVACTPTTICFCEKRNSNFHFVLQRKVQVEIKCEKKEADSTQWYEKEEKEDSPIQSDIQALNWSREMQTQMVQRISKTRCFDTNLSVYGQCNRI